MTTKRFPDPYEGMSNDQLDRHFSQLIVEHRQRQRAVSIRFPEELLDEIRELADAMGVGYQTLIKMLLERDVARLRTRPLHRRPAASRPTAPEREPPQQARRTERQTRSPSRKTASKRRSSPRPKVPA